MAAYALHRSPTPLGNYLRRMKAKLGPQAATMATQGERSSLEATPHFTHNRVRHYWIELAACERTAFALEPTSRIVPTTRTRITASITAYSAMS